METMPILYVSSNCFCARLFIAIGTFRSTVYIMPACNFKTVSIVTMVDCLRFHIPQFRFFWHFFLYFYFIISTAPGLLQDLANMVKLNKKIVIHTHACTRTDAELNVIKTEE